MGRPFNSELEKLQSTYQWAKTQVVDEIRNELLSHYKRPLFIVGSGGSLSACYYIAMLFQHHGMMAKAITPLELFYSKEALRASNVLFISASGQNTDVLFGYQTAIGYEPNRIFSLCMKLNSPLAKLARTVSISRHFEFNLPSGKDGFLATNSLIAFFGIAFKALAKDYDYSKADINLNDGFIDDHRDFVSKVTPDYTFTVLHAGWGQCIAIDLESKLAEAALGDILISDYRNFGHGRHHWFDKRKVNAAIIALITPDEKEIAKKTLALLPADIPVLMIETTDKTEMASIELLIKSFYFVSSLGKIQNIDPGRPGVPDFGSKLYHLNYKRFYKPRESRLSENKRMAIVRKACVSSFENLSDSDKAYWVKSYDSFINRLTATEFGALIFDYDGTICSSEERFTHIGKDIAKYLNNFLSKGIIIGIATGRGKSVREKLQEVILPEYWNQVVIGYYNCSDFGLLCDNNLPDKNLEQNPILNLIFERLEAHEFLVKLKPELKPHQIIIEINDNNEWGKVRESIIQFIIGLDQPNIQILESSHSMDIIDQTFTNKLNIIEKCKKMTAERNLCADCLCIGDKGKWPGNDYQLLSSAFSLSVDEVSAVNNSCWNIANSGIKNVDATIFYLSCLNFNQKGLILNIT